MTNLKIYKIFIVLLMISLIASVGCILILESKIDKISALSWNISNAAKEIAEIAMADEQSYKAQILQLNTALEICGCPSPIIPDESIPTIEPKNKSTNIIVMNQIDRRPE